MFGALVARWGGALTAERGPRARVQRTDAEGVRVAHIARIVFRDFSEQTVGWVRLANAASVKLAACGETVLRLKYFVLAGVLGVAAAVVLAEQ